MLNSIEGGNCLLLTFAFPQQGIYVFFRIGAFLQSLPGYTSFQFPSPFCPFCALHGKTIQKAVHKNEGCFKSPAITAITKILWSVARSVVSTAFPPRAWRAPASSIWTAVCKGSAHFVLVPPDAHGNVEQEVTQKKLCFCGPFATFM